MLSLVQSQKQSLKISPAQIQLLNFLQLTSLELEQYIKNELEDNPVLEEGTDDTADEFDEFGTKTADSQDRTQDYMDWDEFSNDDTPDYRTRINNYTDDDTPYTATLVETKSWRDDLKEQFHLLDLDERQEYLADFLVDSLTDEGYLKVSAQSLADDASFTSGLYVEKEEMQTLLEILRDMEPAGLGARNLQECLLAQLERKPNVEIAKKMVKNHFEELANHHYDKLMRTYSLGPEALKEVLSTIAHLNPHPIVGGQPSGALVVKESIVPDYIVTVEGETIEVALNARGIPPLRINKAYAQNLGGSRAANTYVNNKINTANWLIDAIQQREATMLKTMRVIAALQREYFLTGDERLLKPMILKDIAEQIGMDISTVSRVTSSKYAQTPFGVIHLKDLFTEGFTTDSGEEVSNRQIQVALAELVEKEDKHHPLNDTQLMELLAEQGYQVARRTVAKYREVQGIPSVQMRRVL
jgi:RNA polymerase sigma-54 factor